MPSDGGNCPWKLEAKPCGGRMFRNRSETPDPLGHLEDAGIDGFMSGGVGGSNMYRQGDVLLVRVQSLPRDADRIGRRGAALVLAKGESSGHAHTLDFGADLFMADLESFVRIGAKGGVLRHEEHGAIYIPRGIYRVVLQRQYRPGGGDYAAD